jgi:predicted alpha/beta-fold hydrolase
MKRSSESPAWLSSFVPRRGLRNGHLQTIVGNYLRREYLLPPVEDLLVEVEEALPGAGAEYGSTRVLCHCHLQPDAVRRERLTVVLVHGLEGSSSSRYILSNTARAWAAGFNVVRMNMRSCGGTDALAPTIYHSGRSGDVRAVVEALRGMGLERIAVVGYSMGGNLVLKYAGEQALAGDEPVAVVGVSPLMDLALSSAALHEPANRIYEWKFLRAMLGRIRRKALLFPELYSVLEREGVPRRIHSLRDFDHQIVARFGGFSDADDYYQSVSSSQFASAFRAPTLILHSLDDPFIRMLPSTREALSGNRNVTFVETMHGGHCAFLAEPGGGRDTFWAERTLLGFLLAVDAAAGRDAR